MSHLPEVDEIDRAKIDAILSGAYAKLERILNNKLLLRAHFKDEQSAGARRKHFVQMHLSAPGLKSVCFISQNQWILANFGDFTIFTKIGENHQI